MTKTTMTKTTTETTNWQTRLNNIKTQKTNLQPWLGTQIDEITILQIKAQNGNITSLHKLEQTLGINTQQAERLYPINTKTETKQRGGTSAVELIVITLITVVFMAVAGILFAGMADEAHAENIQQQLAVHNIDIDKKQAKTIQNLAGGQTTQVTTTINNTPTTCDITHSGKPDTQPPPNNWTVACKNQPKFTLENQQ